MWPTDELYPISSNVIILYLHITEGSLTFMNAHCVVAFAGAELDRGQWACMWDIAGVHALTNSSFSILQASPTHEQVRPESSKLLASLFNA